MQDMTVEWEAITFILDDDNVPDYTRIVRTLSKEIGRLKEGSPTLHDPTHFAAPPWLTMERAAEIYKVHVKGNKPVKFKDRKEATQVLWDVLLPKAQLPQKMDYNYSYRKALDTVAEKMSSTLKAEEFVTADDLVKATRTPLPAKQKKSTLSPDTKIRKTAKSHKSKKNAERVSHYQSNTVETILTRYPDLKKADIKYDLKHGYAKIVP